VPSASVQWSAPVITKRIFAMVVQLRGVVFSLRVSRCQCLEPRPSSHRKPMRIPMSGMGIPMGEAEYCGWWSKVITWT
jgi:hypothetical protein